MSSMEEVSMISNAGLNNNVIGEGSDSNSSSNPCLSNKRQKQEPSRFKGVVSQQNGHWGAQIYSKHSRVWIGTFKTEEEAAMAYDRAAIKLRNSTGLDFHRNLPSTTLTTQEQNFQDLYDKKTYLEMIKDGSYEPKFMDFLRSTISIQMEKEEAAAAGMGLNLMKGCVINNDGGGGGGVLSRQLLFQKELTPSDVGKLNRLVIPKKYAVKYFPQVSKVASEEEEEEGPDAGGVDDLQLVFFDTDRRAWKFRYCYWKSSQSFVFTRGWNRFVREKKLKAKDVITFNRCEHREWLKDQRQPFCVIEVLPSSTTDESNGGGYAPDGFEHGGYAEGKMVLEQQQPGFGPSIECESSVIDRKIWEEKEKQLVVTNGMEPVEPLPVVEKRGIRLFGVTLSVD